jgi:benzodiazapine receptor
MTTRTFLKLAVAIVGTQLAGIIGSLFTFSAIPTWYATLTKPALNPPSWVFGPVWTTLYLLMGVSAFLVWQKGWARKDVKIALSVYVLQLVLNALWSIVFFGMQNPGLALVNIVLLFASIVWTMVLFFKISRPAMYLLIPYILWVSFASYLNYAIYALN